MVMDYMNMYRNSGPQTSYFMPQYISANQATAQLHHQQQQQHQQRRQQQQHSQGYSFPYTNEQLLVLAQMQHQRNLLNQVAANAAAAAANGAAVKQADSKPRLSRNEVELLEKEFQQNPKPSTGRKREIAETLKVEQPRINNWFQNRRAKEKGLKKKKELSGIEEAAESESRSDTEDQGAVSEYYGASNHQQPLQPSSAAFPDDTGSSTETQPEQDASCPSDEGISRLSPDVPLDDDLPDPSAIVVELPVQAKQLDAEGDFYAGDRDRYPSSPQSLPFHRNSNRSPPDLDTTPVAPAFLRIQPIKLEFQGQVHTQTQSQQGLVSCKPENFSDQLGHAHLSPDDLNMQDFALPREQIHSQSVEPYDQFTSAIGPDNILAPTPSFPSQLLGRLEFHELKSELPSDHEQSPSDAICAAAAVTTNGRTEQQPSPNSMPLSPHTPTPTDLRFKSPPPPANIASRRNKGVPAQLSTTALRGYSYGPKTGLDISKRSDAQSSGMRRIASATGPMSSGRIQKPMGGAGPPPRSPLYLERTKEALMRSLSTVRSPVMASINTALSPMTPNDYISMSSHQDATETTVSSGASDDGLGFNLGCTTTSTDHPATTAAVFFPLKTPPGTPGLNGGFTDQMAHLNTFEAAWNFTPQDEPLITPGLGSFGSEEFSMAAGGGQPGYLRTSQPPTPSLSQNIGPSYGGYPWGVFPGGAGGSGVSVHAHSNAEYTFPGEPYIPDVSAKSSPSMAPKSKQFQFTPNITPQDFHDK